MARRVETFARTSPHRSAGRRVRGRLDDADVIIRKVNDCGDEEYRLSIDEEVTIDASTAPASRTLSRSFANWAERPLVERRDARHARTPRLFIEDGPRFAWRVFTWTWLVISSTSRRSVG